jgi:hypothetical protein
MRNVSQKATFYFSLRYDSRNKGQSRTLQAQVRVYQVEAFVLRRGSCPCLSGIEQRDASIKAGAAGATTYVIRDSKFQTPGSSQDCQKDFPSRAWQVLRNELQPDEADVVIVCGSQDRRTSFIGAMSAALSLLD